MRNRRWMTVALFSGLLVPLAACSSDVAYALLSAAVEYLPTVLDTLTTTTTTTS